ncbi:membrane protein [Pullulanibacillus camelliae]|uniref:Membrane protein n=1 Tax=Pullulanibacillus camelliae TaxID=1707096 RepID=A0A8J2VJQ7_9BACL|nr:membrane protein [Pullulanibacillus camelliae]
MVINLLIVVVLIILTAFFVASEFAIVRARKLKIDMMAEEGHRQALAAKKIIEHLDEYLSACQLGITMTALGIGWLGEPTIGHLLEKLFGVFVFSGTVSLTLSTILAFLIVTVVHVVLGELAPKTFAIQKAEDIVLLSARPLIIFNTVAYPFIWILNGSANAIARLFGVKPMSEQDTVHTEEELRQILSESYKSGEINQAEYRYVNRIFEFDNRTAREIMIPRTETICLFLDEPLEVNRQAMKEHKFTRYPVAENDKDNIIGLVNIKELYFSRFMSESGDDITPHIAPILHVFETIPIKQLLVKMQKEQVHMAVLMDEYGGTSGIVTVEDILEEIVGEIRDEFDKDERPMIDEIEEGRFIVDGKTLLSEINRYFNKTIAHDDIDTIGGFILARFPEAREQMEMDIEGLTVKIAEMSGTQIKKVEIRNA